jgi:hypothetical protein
VKDKDPRLKGPRKKLFFDLVEEYRGRRKNNGARRIPDWCPS